MDKPAPTPDQAAAHELLAQLRTRITIQPLPYQYGVEASALESLWGIFEQSRAAIAKYPGCELFATEVTKMLNLTLRPVTAKWHRAHQDGQLSSRDGADEFRGDLTRVQQELREFVRTLKTMAYGTAPQPDGLTPAPMSQAQMDACVADLPYGIPLGTRDLPDQLVTTINQNEHAEVHARREQAGVAEKAGMNAVGLAFSGGGIRSATFCLGVAQVLADRELIKGVDFLSTVSGGGYAGSFLTMRLGGLKQKVATGLTDRLTRMFKKKKAAPDEKEAAPLHLYSEEAVAGPHGPDPHPIRYVRHHAKFLNPINLKDRWAMITGTLAGMLLNWTAPLLLVLVAACVAVLFKQYDTDDTVWIKVFAVSGASTVIALVLYCALLRETPKYIRWAGRWLGWSVALMLVAAFFWGADKGYGCFEAWLASSSEVSRWSLGGVLGFITAGPAIMGFFPLLKQPALRRWALKILLWLAGCVIPLLALLLFYLGRHVGHMAIVGDDVSWNIGRFGGVAVLACPALAFALVGIFLLNVNLTAPHRIYRDRLAKTFIQFENEDEEPVPLATVNPSQRAPYHLLNTTLNLPSSESPALRDRKCAFFVFSKHWCGSATTGYHRTTEWKANGRPVDLATVMAVSGAAASSYMGLGSMPTLTALLTFLNVRLGFWIRQPGPAPFSEAPGFLCLIREMIGWDMDEKKTWLNLSDGGHIENMAVYELLRRRCKYIVCVDGEADPSYTFGGLLTLVRHAQIDYGIRIEPDLKPLRPKPETGYSHAHGILCRVHFPPVTKPDGTVEHPVGLLLYLKLSVTGNETELIKRYREAHPAFPHESTADQFFNEEQFEAYRQLGVHAAEGFFSPAVTDGLIRPKSIRDWFHRLARNLLLPSS